MDTIDIRNIRLYNQQLINSELQTPHDVVSYMGAMQSQAFDMAKWGIGLRLNGATNKQVEKAFNSGEIVRTHILRPTWHFVAAADIHWMFDLSAPRIKPTFVNYSGTVGLDEDLVLKSFRIVEKVLRDENHLTREELGAVFEAEGIIADSRLVGLFLSRAEVEGLVCSGRQKGNKQTYALLHEWVPKKQQLAKEEALEKLTRKFFTSHGPATLQDYVWWSGLLTSDARKGIDLIKHDFICEKINSREFWFKPDIQLPEVKNESALLLPAFDEFIVSYKDRSDILAEKDLRKIITRTGIFAPALSYNGEIIGSWKKIKKGGRNEVELTFFDKTSKAIQNLFKEVSKEYISFLEK